MGKAVTSFYSEEELKEIGFKSLGKNVLLSRNTCIYGAGKISIGDNSRIDDFALLSGNITIGKHVHIAAYTGLFAGSAGIVVEDFCGISAHCSVYAASDDYSGQALTNPTVPDEYKCVTEKRVTFERHSLVGAGSVVLPGVHIGEGASFGSMSLITKDAKPWTMYVGAPAKELRPRDRKPLELEKQLLEDELKKDAK